MDRDANFVNNFFSNVIIRPNVGKNCNGSNIPEFRNNVIEALEICEIIRHREEYIRRDLSAMSDQCFNEEIKNIQSLKCLLNFHTSKLTDTNFESVKVKLAKRVSKRLRLKRMQNARKLQKNIQMKVNEEKQKELERKMTTIKAEIEEMKRIESVNLEANMKLKEVHKCKSETRKNISLLDNLCKLRLAREKSALGRGCNVSQANSKMFIASIEKLKLLWNTALNKYEVEEKSIKSMLESKTENLKVVDETSSIVSNWKSVMFGDDTMPQRNFEGNMEQFLRVRKSWDRYICSEEEGSKIPLGWLTPPTPSEGWRNYISHIVI